MNVKRICAGLGALALGIGLAACSGSNTIAPPANQPQMDQQAQQVANTLIGKMIMNIDQDWIGVIANCPAGWGCAPGGEAPDSTATVSAVSVGPGSTSINSGDPDGSSWVGVTLSDSADPAFNGTHWSCILDWTLSDPSGATISNCTTTSSSTEPSFG